VTDLVDNQKALEEKNSELAKLNDLKNTFIGMAAHDLRGPLVQVLWSCEMLFDEDSDISVEDRKTMGSLIQNSCEHMLALIDDLLDVALIETGKLVLDQSPSFLNDLLEASIVAHKPHAQQKSIAIEIAPTDGPVVMVDPRRIRQVLDNLISNAVKYSYPETTVGVSVERVNSGWRVNVRDQGPGLTAEDKRKIFGDFQKLSARPTGGEKSSGLGLAIAKRIVTAHHGEIGADSEQGRGAVFWFTIPDV
jgi:signal transduction histidine kinase